MQEQDAQQASENNAQDADHRSPKRDADVCAGKVQENGHAAECDTYSTGEQVAVRFFRLSDPGWIMAPLPRKPGNVTAIAAEGLPFPLSICLAVSCFAFVRWVTA